METRILNKEGYFKLYDAACGHWKDVLAKFYATDILHEGEATVKFDRYLEMVSASNDDQKKILHEVFDNWAVFNVGDKVYVKEGGTSIEAKTHAGKVVTLERVERTFVSKTAKANHKTDGGMHLDEVRLATKLDIVRQDYPEGTWVVGWHNGNYRDLQWNPWRVGEIKESAFSGDVIATCKDFDGSTEVSNLRKATPEEIMEVEFVSFKPKRLEQNPLEKFIHDKFRKDYCNGDTIRLERLVFEQKDDYPVDQLSERERKIVISTIQWLGTNVGKGFLHSCGFDHDKERIDL